MSNTNYEHKGGVKNYYQTLNKTWKYSCPATDSNYHAFNGGCNCLCPKEETNKSTISNPRLGWKL